MSNDAVNKAYVDALSQGIDWTQATQGQASSTAGQGPLGIGASNGFPGVLSGSGNVQIGPPIGSSMHIGNGAGFQAGGGAGGAAWIGQLGGAGGISGGVTFGFPGLNNDELKELEVLEREHKETVKVRQLDLFKKLPATMRQNIVDMIEWDENVDKMDAEMAAMDPRLADLKNRHVNSTLGSTWYNGNFPGLSARTRLPQNITAEEIKMAHAERSMEEEILGVKE